MSGRLGQHARMGRRAFLLIAAGLSCGAAQGAEGWSLEAYGGDAANFRNRLEISQDGGYSEWVSARYRTRGLRTPLYYVLRGARWSDDKAWEISFIHHKLYLANPPAGVSSLSITHGFNIFSLARAFKSGDWSWRVGAGPVITHAEATINGTQYDGPYKLSGAALLVGAGRRFYLGRSTFVSLEGMLTAAYANPRLPGPPDGELKVINTALHALVGVGYEF